MKSVLITGAIALLSASPLVAQNVAQNPNFDIDLSQWTASAYAPSAWDTLDANDAVESGSALLTNVLGNGGSTAILDQCFSVQEGQVLDYSAEVYQPGGQTGSGYGHLRGRFYSSPGCSGFIQSTGSGHHQPDFDTWFTVYGSETVPETAVSFSLYLAVVGETSGEDFAVHFDEVVMTVGESPGIFSDGFEDGTTDAWALPTR